MMGDTFKTLAEGDNFLKEKGMTQILEINKNIDLNEGNQVLVKDTIRYADDPKFKDILNKLNVKGNE